MESTEIMAVFWEVIGWVGGVSVIIVGLVSWLGAILAKRILQKERGQIEQQLSNIRHELGLMSTSYSQHLQWITDYYAHFWNHYQLCKKAGLADAVLDKKSGEMTSTKDTFFEKLPSVLSDWRQYEGRIRLFLPQELLTQHEEAIKKFNEFRDAVWDFDPSETKPRKKEIVYGQLQDIKQGLEEGLREYLRTDKLHKPT